ncbi:MAG TPA: hypothetical protein DCS05_00945 [Nitrospiraceae bacterium]|nr:hypothetical protein [Nitrospiraceae bacterium]
MALLGSFVNAGAACLAAGLTCFAHGLVGFAPPDHAEYQLRSMGANSASIPVMLETLNATTVIWRNGNGAGVPGNHFVILCHNIIR